MTRLQVRKTLWRSKGLQARNQGSIRKRWQAAVLDKAFEIIRRLSILQTRPEPFLRVLELGIACAGVACADGSFGASGAAPRARLMPIRLASGLGSQAEADAFIWAAQHGADVNFL